MGKPRRKHFNRRPAARGGATRGGSSADSYGGGQDGPDMESFFSGEEFERVDEDVVLKLLDGNDGALCLWRHLSKEEQVEVLDLDEYEMSLALQDKLNISRIPPAIVQKVLDDDKYMTALRMSFVFALSNNGMMLVVEMDPLAYVVVKLMERHLLLMYQRKSYQSKVLLLASAASFFVAPLWFPYRVIIAAALLALLYYKAKYPIIREVQETVMLMFEDSSADRLHARVSCFCVGLLSLYTGSWVTWYSVLVILVLLPLLFLELEFRLSTDADDVHALGKIRTLLQWVSGLVLLYLSWYSMPWFLCVLVFTFPTIARLSVAYGCKAVSFVLWLSASMLGPANPVRAVPVQLFFVALYLYPIVTGNWVLFLPFVSAHAMLLPTRWLYILQNGVEMLGTVLLRQKVDVFLAHSYGYLAWLVLYLGASVAWKKLLEQCGVKKQEREEHDQSRRRTYDSDSE